MFGLIDSKKDEKLKEIDEKKAEIMKHHEELTLIDRPDIVQFMTIIYGYMIALLLGINIFYFTLYYQEDVTAFYKQNIFLTILSVILHIYTLLSLLLIKDITNKCLYRHIVVIIFFCSTIGLSGIFSYWIDIKFLLIFFLNYLQVMLLNFIYTSIKKNHYVLFNNFVFNFIFLTVSFLAVSALFYEYLLKVFLLYLLMLFYSYYINKCFVYLLKDDSFKYDFDVHDYHLFSKIYLYSFFGILAFIKELVLVKFCQIPALIKEAYKFFVTLVASLKGEMCKFLFKLLCCF